MANDFDLFGFLEARTFPTKDVTVIIDESIALEAVPLLKELEELKDKHDNRFVKEDEKVKIGKRISEIEKDLKALGKRAEDADKMTFHLQGIPQSVFDGIITGSKSIEDESERNDSINHKLLSAMLRGVTPPNGERSDKTYSAEEIERLEGILPLQSTLQLRRAVNEMSASSLAYDGMNDAGFFPKS